MLLDDRIASRLEHALEAPQYGKGQNDGAVLGLPKITAEQLRDVPDVVSEVFLIHLSPHEFGNYP